MFAWCLAGAVALAVYSGRPNVPAEAPLALVPADEAPSGKQPSDLLPGQKPGNSPSKGMPALKAISWESSFEGAMKKARAQGKPVMIDFYTDWCHWCKVLDKDVYTDKGVITESSNWISVKVNAEKRTDIARAYNVTGFPTIAFIESDGKPIDTIPGFAPMPEFLNLMRTAYSKRAQPSQA